MFPEWAKQRWWWSRHQEHPRLLLPGNAQLPMRPRESKVLVSLPDLQPGDELREHVSDGGHPRQRRNLSDHRGEGSCQRSCQERAQPHVQLWWVAFLLSLLFFPIT